MRKKFKTIVIRLKQPKVRKRTPQRYALTKTHKDHTLYRRSVGKAIPVDE